MCVYNVYAQCVRRNAALREKSLEGRLMHFSAAWTAGMDCLYTPIYFFKIPAPISQDPELTWGGGHEREISNAGR